MSLQIRLSASLAGTGQDTLTDLLTAYHDFFGINGDEWNNTGVGGRWDAGDVWTNNLAAVSGQPLDVVLDHIDDLAGLSDTNFANANLTRAASEGALTHEFNNNSLTINSTSNMILNNSIFQVTSSAAVGMSAVAEIDLDGPITQLRALSSTNTQELRFREAGDNGVNFWSIRAPQNLVDNISVILPEVTATADGKALGVLSGGGTQQLVLGFIDAAGGVTIERGQIEFDTPYTAGTSIPLDGTGANQTLIANSDVISLTGIASQADLQTDKGINFWVDGIRADLSGETNAHLTVQYVSTSAVSLDKDVPAGTILEIEKVT